MTPKPFSVRIFLADGTVDGVKVIAKSKWTGRGVVIPRSLLPVEAGREELNAPGVYILVGAAGVDVDPVIAIGAADRVGRQLLQEQKRGFWSWVLASTAKKDPLSAAAIDYLAIRLRQLATAAQLVNHHVVDTLPQLTADEQAETEVYLAHLLEICPLLGLTAFELPKTQT